MDSQCHNNHCFVKICAVNGGTVTTGGAIQIHGRNSISKYYCYQFLAMHVLYNYITFTCRTWILNLSCYSCHSTDLESTAVDDMITVLAIDSVPLHV